MPFSQRGFELTLFGEYETNRNDVRTLSPPITLLKVPDTYGWRRVPILAIKASHLGAVAPEELWADLPAGLDGKVRKRDTDTGDRRE